MTSQNSSRDDFDRLMRQWMEADSHVREPENLLESVLVQTKGARRRPGWLLPERWVPDRVTIGLRAMPRLAPILLLIALLLAAIVAVILVGSRPRLPDLFGLASNGRVAFLSNGQIYTANPDGSDPIQLTIGSRPAATPVWSRDGTRVPYKLISPASPADDPTLFGDLVVVNADGTNPVTIDRELKGMSPTMWSPDSRWLLYSRAEGTIDQVYVAAADGSSPPVRVGNRGTHNWAPSFSPDGTKIAYFVDVTAVEVMNRDGSEPQRLNTTDFQELSSFEWHPDGKRIVVSAAANDEKYDLWILSLDGAPEQHLQVPGRAEVGPSWSPDGSRLLYLTTKDGRSTKVAIAAADGTNERLLPGGYGMISPTWSPDGSRIAAVNDLGTFARVSILDPEGVAKPIVIDGTPYGALVVENITGGGLVQVSPSVSVTYKHDWAPDGQHLVVSDNSDPSPDEAVNVVTVRPDGSDWTYLTHYPAGYRANVGGYSPDGQWIVFRLEGPGLVPTMYRIRPDGTDLHALYSSSTIIPRFIDWGPAVGN